MTLKPWSSLNLDFSDGKCVSDIVILRCWNDLSETLFGAWVNECFPEVNGVYPEEVTGQVSFPSQSAAAFGWCLNWKMEGAIGCWGVTRGTAFIVLRAWHERFAAWSRLCVSLSLFSFILSINTCFLFIMMKSPWPGIWVVKKKNWSVMESSLRMKNTTAHRGQE